jgi:Protein of unknown function (DUF3108)
MASLSLGGNLPERESLQYNIEWRLISAGKATLDFRSDPPGEASRVNLRVESVGMVSKLFRVEDDYMALLSSSLCVQNVHSVSQEGSRQREARITFDSAGRKANYVERDRARNSVILSKEIETPPCVHDVIGGLYYLRTLNLEPGESTQVPISDGKKSVVAKVESQQREDVKTPAGTFHTIRYEIFLFDNVLYRRSAHLNVWLTDDRRKLPVQIRVRLQFTIGTITLQLEKQA